MDAWWIILLSFVAGFAVCMAIAGWVVAWWLWQTPQASGNVPRLAFIDPESALQNTEECELEESFTIDEAAPGRISDDENHRNPRLKADSSLEADRLLLNQVFEENLALRTPMQKPRLSSMQTMHC